MTLEPNIKQCAAVNLQSPVKLIISLAFVEGLIAVAVLLYNNVLVYCLPAYSCQLFLYVVFNFRSYRPSWQPRNCLRDWRSLWGVTLLMVAPWLPTEKFTMKEPSSPQRKTDPWRPELGKPAWPWPWGKQALDLAIRTQQTGFSLQGQEFLREWRVFAWCEGIVAIPDSAQEIEWQVEKLAYLIVIQFVLGSVVSVSFRNNTCCWLGVLSATFEACTA